MKKMRVFMLLASTLLVSACSANKKTFSETEAKNALTSYHSGYIELDPETILEHSKSIVWPTWAEYEFELRSIDKDNPAYHIDKLVDYSVLDFKKVNDVQFVATVDHKLSSDKDLPAFEIPIIKEEGKWLVVHEGVTFLNKETQFTNSNGIEIVGENDKYVATVPSYYREREPTSSME